MTSIPTVSTSVNGGLPKIPDWAKDFGNYRFERRNDRILVRKLKPETEYIIDEYGRCNCHAGLYGKECRHVQMVTAWLRYFVCPLHGDNTDHYRVVIQRYGDWEHPYLVCHECEMCRRSAGDRRAQPLVWPGLDITLYEYRIISALLTSRTEAQNAKTQHAAVA